jgi:ribosomal protein S18 acetylase RimI-like enzyme
MTEPIAQRLEWDSEFFGAAIGRVAGTTPRDIERAVDCARRDNLECLYLLVPGDNFESRDTAVSLGFQCVGTRVTYRCHDVNAGDGRPPNPPADPLDLRPAGAEDLAILEDISKGAFYDSRFFWDNNIPRERAEELYATWVRKSVQGGYADAAYVARVDGKIGGFVTLDVRNEIGHIALIAVHRDMRGAGIGSSLVRTAHTYYAERGVLRAEVVTHGSNVGAQRLYARHGYQLATSETWFHWWRPTRATD